MPLLEIKNLHIEVEGKEVLKGASFSFDTSKIHVLMGPNGSGKSSLAYTLMGHPSYTITKGNIFWDKEDITEYSPTEKAKLGIFLSFQNPIEIPGLTVGKYLKRIKEISLGEENSLNVKEFIANTRALLEEVGLSGEFLNRYLNEGFSGGEKKRMEMLQLLTLSPNFSLLDEIDSGLDIDALKRMANIIDNFHKKERKGCLIITHQYKILEHLNIDTVSILKSGKLVAQGEKDLAQEIEHNGYDKWIRGE